LYIDVPFDNSNSLYRKLEEYCENPDGSSRYPDMTLWISDLDRAMKNASHDEDDDSDNM